MKEFEQAKRDLENFQQTPKPKYEVKVITDKNEAIKAKEEGFEVHEIRLSSDVWVCCYCQTINSIQTNVCVNCGASRKA